MSLLSFAMGHKERGLAEMIQAQLLDPSSENAHDDLGWAYYLNGRYGEAVAESRMALQLDQQSISAHHQLGKEYLQLHKFDQAQSEFEATMKLNEIQRGFADLGQLYALTGKADRARSVLTELQIPQRRSYESEYMRAVLLAALGDKDAAFQQLEMAVSRRLSRAIWMQVDPDLNPLHSDSRFQALLRRVHLLN
jgi:Flp pilus assembly protein TadD